MDKCIFCMIADKELPSKVIYEDEYVVAFDDIRPQAPVHVVIISKKHFQNVNELAEKNTESRGENGFIIEAMINACVKVAEVKGIKDSGYRIINNCGEGAGQTVMHIHFHVLGGQTLGESL